MKKKRLIGGIIVVVIFVIIFALIFGWKAFVNAQVKKYLANFTVPPSKVSVVKSKAVVWQPFIESTGILQALNGVDVTPQTSGLVTGIYFKSGQMVTKGQKLVQIDPREARAQLDNAIAAVKLAEINYHRQLRLYQKDAVSKSSLDTATATLAEDRAKVAQFQAQLSYKTVRAPFSGKIGIKDVDLGQYLNSGNTIANLQTLDPIHVNYYVPEQEISKLYIGQPVELTVGTYPGVTFTGKVMALDSQVSDQTKSIQVQALVPNHNPKALLLPGMFAMVHTLLPKENDLIVVPQTAITYTLYGDSVYVVAYRTDKKGKREAYAKLTYVTIGQQRGDEVAITQGLKAGEQVVSEGQVKLQNGAAIVFGQSKHEAPSATKKPATS